MTISDYLKSKYHNPSKLIMFRKNSKSNKVGASNGRDGTANAGVTSSRSDVNAQGAAEVSHGRGGAGNIGPDLSTIEEIGLNGGSGNGVLRGRADGDTVKKSRDAAVPQVAEPPKPSRVPHHRGRAGTGPRRRLGDGSFYVDTTIYPNETAPADKIKDFIWGLIVPEKQKQIVAEREAKQIDFENRLRQHERLYNERMGYETANKKAYNQKQASVNKHATSSKNTANMVTHPADKVYIPNNMIKIPADKVYIPGHGQFDYIPGKNKPEDYINLPAQASRHEQKKEVAEEGAGRASF